ncbi:MAG: UDP-N-acetylmuramate--L-alanine ligase [Gemmatimonadales bacterium]
MGIAGAGMSGLALIARQRGVGVTGCDTDPSGAADLVAMGAQVWQGHDPAHINGVRAVVVTAAVPADHPELARARALGLPVVPRKEALAELVRQGRTIGIAGTHGKSTTTVMVTEALVAAGLAPTGLAGGRVQGWGGNARPGDDRIFVVESDEYDQAFLALHPSIAVVNNIEADHLECYGSLALLEEAFAQFAGRAERVLAGADDPGAARMAARLGNRVWRFGLGDADIRITEVELAETGSRATVVLADGRRVALRLRVPGLHNVRNATAALGVVAALDAPLEAALAALAAYGGLGRRFERLGEINGVAVVDDYAHHPTELAATLAAARQAFPGRRIVAVFQPHLYSRTAQHATAMGEALAAADLVIVADVYGAREQPLPGVSGALVATAARRAGAETIFEPVRARLTDRVQEVMRSGDLVLTMGAGDVTRVGRELVACLPAA